MERIRKIQYLRKLHVVSRPPDQHTNIIKIAFKKTLKKYETNMLELDVGSYSEFEQVLFSFFLQVACLFMSLPTVPKRNKQVHFSHNIKNCSNFPILLTGYYYYCLK